MDLAGGAIVWVFWVLFAPPPDELAREAARRVFEDPTYQRALPPADAEKGGRDRGKAEKWRPRRGTPERKSRRLEGSGDSPSGAAIGEMLLWVLAIAGVVVIAVWLMREWGGRTRGYAEKPEKVEKARAPPSAAAAAASPVLAVAVPPRTSADDLAQEGRFAEAVHALLLDALAALGSAAGASRLSLTSREVLAGAEAVVPPSGRAALSDLVLAVETTRFGERASGASEWTSARDAHARFLAVRPRGPA